MSARSIHPGFRGPGAARQAARQEVSLVPAPSGSVRISRNGDLLA